MSMNKQNQLIAAAEYAIAKLGLVLAFGDSIGEKVSKCELGHVVSHIAQHCAVG